LDLPVLVVGSVALDTIETPFGRVEDALGGSATYFSLAARLLDEVRLVGVVGEDFPDAHRRTLRDRGVRTDGLVTECGRTFRWTGAYKGAMNEAETLAVELNVFGSFEPRIPESFSDSEYVFLANGSPRVQMAVREKFPSARLVVADTMNYYIANALPDLKRLLGVVHGLVLNDQEARQLSGSDSLMEAGESILDMGPSFVIIKKGEHGALLLSSGAPFALPAFPTPQVKDPTGAGDSFAGGMMGFLSSTGDLSPMGLRRAVAYGTAVASITVEGFGTASIEAARRADVESRLAHLREMLRF
jgi:sugar/nucleoside kinase (ribokinase family)